MIGILKSKNEHYSNIDKGQFGKGERVSNTRFSYFMQIIFEMTLLM